MKVTCVGGPYDGWEGNILHGRKIVFSTEPKAEYKITDNWNTEGRYIAVPVEPAKN